MKDRVIHDWFWWKLKLPLQAYGKGTDIDGDRSDMECTPHFHLFNRAVQEHIIKDDVKRTHK
jgi:hypothetical protein